jgi:hypothetical protein
LADVLFFNVYTNQYLPIHSMQESLTFKIVLVASQVLPVLDALPLLGHDLVELVRERRELFPGRQVDLATTCLAQHPDDVPHLGVHASFVLRGTHPPVLTKTTREQELRLVWFSQQSLASPSCRLHRAVAANGTTFARCGSG